MEDTGQTPRAEYESKAVGKSSKGEEMLTLPIRIKDSAINHEEAGPADTVVANAASAAEDELVSDAKAVEPKKSRMVTLKYSTAAVNPDPKPMDARAHLGRGAKKVGQAKTRKVSLAEAESADDEDKVTAGDEAQGSYVDLEGSDVESQVNEEEVAGGASKAKDNATTTASRSRKTKKSKRSTGIKATDKAKEVGKIEPLKGVDWEMVKQSDPRLPMNIEFERQMTLGGSAPVFVKDGPADNIKTVVLPTINLVILKPSFPARFKVTDVDIMNWLKSNEVLPLLKLWRDKLANIEPIVPDQHMPDEDDPLWNVHEGQVAACAEQFALGKVKLTEDERFKGKLAAFYARRLANSSEDFGPLAKLPKGAPRFLACTRVVLTAFADMYRRPGGFFAVLFDSKLTVAMRPAVRVLWEAKWVVSEVEKGSKKTGGSGDAMEVD